MLIDAAEKDKVRVEREKKQDRDRAHVLDHETLRECRPINI